MRAIPLLMPGCVKAWKRSRLLTFYFNNYVKGKPGQVRAGRFQCSKINILCIKRTHAPGIFSRLSNNKQGNGEFNRFEEQLLYYLYAKNPINI